MDRGVDRGLIGGLIGWVDKWVERVCYDRTATKKGVKSPDRLCYDKQQKRGLNHLIRIDQSYPHFPRSAGISLVVVVERVG